MAQDRPGATDAPLTTPRAYAASQARPSGYDVPLVVVVLDLLLSTLHWALVGVGAVTLVRALILMF